MTAIKIYARGRFVMECAAQSELLRRAQSSSRRVPLVCLAARTSLPSATSSSSSLRCPPASSPHHPLPRPVSDRAPSCPNHRFNHSPLSIFTTPKPPLLHHELPIRASRPGAGRRNVSGDPSNHIQIPARPGRATSLFRGI